MRELRCRAHRGAARGRAAQALWPRRDRDGIHAVGDRPGARGHGSSADLRPARHHRGDDPVADARALGSRRASRLGRHKLVVDRRGSPHRADRDRSRTTVATDRTARGASVCWGQCNAVMGIAVCASEKPSPPRWIADGAERRMAPRTPAGALFTRRAEGDPCVHRSAPPA